MISRSYFLVLLLPLAAALACTGQQPPGKPPEPVVKSSILERWHWLQTEKQVTNSLPTDYRIGAVYRLKKDVVVECGGTASRVTRYWVSETETDPVEHVKQCLRDPRAAKEAEIESVRRAMAHMPGGLDGLLNLEVFRIRHRRESRSILQAGTMLRFQQVGVQRSFEMGVTVHPYVEIFGGPLQKKWVDIFSLSDSETGKYAHCNLKPQFLEYVGK